MPRLLLTLLLTLAASSPAYAIEIPGIGSWFSADESSDQAPTTRSGTRDWWRKHRNKAVFVPGEGYRVEGYEGFFDSEGRPIDAPLDEIAVTLVGAEESGGGILPGLDPGLAAKRVKEAVGYGPDRAEAEQLLNEGVAAFERRRYGRAAGLFERSAARWPGTPTAAKALFNRSESLFFDKKYEDAADAYVLLLTEHPNTPRLNDAVERMWSIAQYWEQDYFRREHRPWLDTNFTVRTRPSTDTIGHAVRLYDAIRLNDPTGPRADDAIMATAGIHFRRQRYHDADYHYGLLRTEYPRSEHQFDAHLLGLQAKMRKYQGPDYDSTPLDEAKKLEERVRLNFGGRLSDEERERMTTVRAQLAAMIEQRDLRMADYYLGTEQNASARIYLSKVLQEYPDSPTAEEARNRLAAIQDQPDSPEAPMGWFVGLFPKNQEQSAVDEITEISPGPSLNPDADVTRIAESPEGDATSTR